MDRSPLRIPLLGLVAFAGAATLGGCSVHFGPFGWSRPRVWIEESERFDVGGASLDRLELVTHNGAVHLRANPEGDDVVHVTAIKRAGGSDDADAREALSRLDVVRRAEGGRLELTGDCKERRSRDGWSSIGFEIALPPRLDVRLESHNGEITVEGTRGAIALLSHNGRLEVDAPARRVRAKTHNGSIAYRGPAEEVAIETQNGRVEAALTGGIVNGRIETRNGAVAVQAASGVRGTLEGETRNGAVSIRTASRRCQIQESGSADSFVVEFADPSAGRLKVETSNGAIDVR